MRPLWRFQRVGDELGSTPAPDEVAAAFLGSSGLYVHVPFCRSICPHCPYNKVRYREDLVSRYFGALKSELRLYEVGRRSFTSLYVGGGTPSLCLDELGGALSGIRVEGERAIELFPTHATPETVSRLEELGFTHVSLGIQSFDEQMLRHLGRLNRAGDNRRALAATVDRFACVNADLIFDAAFGNPAVFLHDFEVCCHSGVDQISTYPLMHFGFTPLGKAPHAPRVEHELLRRAGEVAKRLGYERRSVWTFNRVGGPLYASIARELYLGTGAGAATFTGRDFLVNHFGLEQYAAALAAGRLPIARRACLDPVRAALYCAFWQLYAPGLDLDRFRRLFPGARWIVPLCGVLMRTGHLTCRDGRVRLTEKGFDRYHDLERWVTYHMIEPLWREMLEEHAGSPPGSVVAADGGGRRREHDEGRWRTRLSSHAIRATRS